MSFLNKKLLVTSLMVLSLSNYALAQENPYLDKSRKSAQKLMSTLKTTLESFLKNGETSNAVVACSSLAQDMATNISKSEGVEIKRVSLRFRNPKDKPDTFEEEQLQAFEHLKQEKLLTPDKEIYKETQEGDKKYFRYMKPIIAGKTCLQCHGQEENIKPEVLALLKSTYPLDLALNHQEGDLRGAVSIKILLDKAN